MKKPTLPLLLSAALLLVWNAGALAQKKALDHDVYDRWESVRSVSLSDDGRILSYQIAPQEGDGRLVIRNLETGRELVLDRASLFRMPKDASVASCVIAPPFAVTRQARIDGKKKDEMPKDTLALVDLSTFEVRKFEAAEKVDMGYSATSFILASIKVDDPADSSAKKVPAMLRVSLPGWDADTIRNVSSFEISRLGDKYAYVSEPAKGDTLSGNRLFVTDGSLSAVLDEGKDRKYSGVRFNDAGDKLLFMFTDQKEDKDGTPRHSVFLAEEGGARPWAARELIGAEDESLPEGWIVSSRSDPQFSNSASRLVLNLYRHFPAKDTTMVDFETPGLDIWRWDSLVLPPMDKASPRHESLSAVLNFDSPSLLTLSANPNDHIEYPAGADAAYGISLDTDKYALKSMWEADETFDVSLVSLADGSRRTVREGLTGTVTFSPYGRYMLHFNPKDGHWYSLDLVSGGDFVNLTARTGVAFHDEEDDHPLDFLPCSTPRWMGADEYVLIADRYDIWKFTPDGRKAENLTRGDGRARKVNYYLTNLVRSGNPYLYEDIFTFPKKGRLYLGAFGEEDSRNGFALADAAAPSVPEGFLDSCSFRSVVKAKDDDRIVYLKGDFRNPMNIFVTEDDWKTQTRLSEINPWQEDYLWGDVQLVRWNAYDGQELKGLLYTPDNIDVTKKYPMMIYFYEKYSETLYDYISPAPSRSIINIPFFVSRGYVVFVPDITYEVGHPGESAYNCVCSGAEAMCSRFGFIDRERMGIQGQSWGGFQTAYLVTRTDMFAAAGAGAPVGNMTSAYGGIRWESGYSRIPQYEFGQSRIGKDLWEEGGLDLYIENSPVFFAPRVNTPVLIMHNDNDGAVPWYQGIEFFMSLRRLGKPAWLLEYNDEAHNLRERRNCKDLSIRLQQFFDHYLMGAPEPVWMKSGIPYARKGQYFGYEYAE